MNPIIYVLLAILVSWCLWLRLTREKRVPESRKRFRFDPIDYPDTVPGWIEVERIRTITAWQWWWIDKLGWKRSDTMYMITSEWI